MEKNNKENYINRKTLVHMYFQIILKKKLIFKNNVQPKMFELNTDYFILFFFSCRRSIIPGLKGLRKVSPVQSSPVFIQLQQSLSAH